MTDRQRHGLILLLVAGLIAASVAGDRDASRRASGSTSRAASSSSTRASRRRRRRSRQASLQRAVDVMHNRVNQLGVSQPQIRPQGSNQIDVQLPDVTNTARAESEVGTTAQLRSTTGRRTR